MEKKNKTENENLLDIYDSEFYKIYNSLDVDLKLKMEEFNIDLYLQKFDLEHWINQTKLYPNLVFHRGGFWITSETQHYLDVFLCNKNQLPSDSYLLNILNYSQWEDYALYHEAAPVEMREEDYLNLEIYHKQMKIISQIEQKIKKKALELYDAATHRVFLEKTIIEVPERIKREFLFIEKFNDFNVKMEPFWKNSAKKFGLWQDFSPLDYFSVKVENFFVSVGSVSSLRIYSLNDDLFKLKQRIVENAKEYKRFLDLCYKENNVCKFKSDFFDLEKQILLNPLIFQNYHDDDLSTLISSLSS